MRTIPVGPSYELAAVVDGDYLHDYLLQIETGMFDLLIDEVEPGVVTRATVYYPTGIYETQGMATAMVCMASVGDVDSDTFVAAIDSSRVVVEAGRYILTVDIAFQGSIVDQAAVLRRLSYQVYVQGGAKLKKLNNIS